MKDFEEETIVALATPRGAGAIAMVRLSGQDALTIAKSMIKRPLSFTLTNARRLKTVVIRDGRGDVIDHALLAFFRKPKSYTGEDLVEFFLHNSNYIIAKTMDRSCELGARIAEPGEFTKRAFLNGKMDLAQAEAVADLIAASGEQAHRAAVLLREGVLSTKIRQIRDGIVALMARIELNLDFAEQDAEPINITEMKERLEGIERSLEELTSSFRIGRMIREGVKVVIAGAPNVGKSTLFNALLGEERAIVDDSPGTTRDAVEAVVEWAGISIRLMDTAGQKEGFAGADRKAAERAILLAREGDVVLWVEDTENEGNEPPPIEISENCLYVVNKTDLLKKQQERRKSAKKLYVSARMNSGLEAITEAVLQKIKRDESRNPEAGIITRERHYELVRKSLENIREAKQNVAIAAGEEIILVDLEEASEHLGEIIGEISSEEVLRAIFAEFCIGK
ncbi:MAG: tRNA uridine-5-carboxymethylaminomethyl(34) synthesis GTPase MnmE [bacterium]